MSEREYQNKLTVVAGGQSSKVRSHRQLPAYDFSDGRFYNSLNGLPEIPFILREDVTRSLGGIFSKNRSVPPSASERTHYFVSRDGSTEWVKYKRGNERITLKVCWDKRQASKNRLARRHRNLVKKRRWSRS